MDSRPASLGDAVPPGAIPFSELPALLPGRPHLATCHRWRQRGVAGVKLRTFKIGGRRFVDPQDLAEFIQRLSDDDTPAEKAETVRQRTRRRQREISQAKSFLDSQGL